MVRGAEGEKLKLRLNSKLRLKMALSKAQKSQKESRLRDRTEQVAPGFELTDDET